MDKIVETNELVLKAQSRSFSIPILNLETKLKLPIMVEYNLNKLIDTIEDNPKLDVNEKKSLILEFLDELKKDNYSESLRKSVLDRTPDDEAYVFKHYPEIIALFKTLPKKMKHLAYVFCEEMAEGMITFLERPIETMKDLDKYCYYVAGTVGIYLTNVVQHYYGFSENIIKVKNDAKHYGLFLQKLNILRDYHEDKISKHREFWPRQLTEHHPKEKVFSIIAESIVKEHIPSALEYYQSLPKQAETYVSFNRFIIVSSLEYFKLLLTKRSVFSSIKLKLPRPYISNLYHRTARSKEEDFVDLCISLKNQCHNLIG